MVAFWYKELLSAGVGFLFAVLGTEEDTYMYIYNSVRCMCTLIYAIDVYMEGFSGVYVLYICNNGIYDAYVCV